MDTIVTIDANHLGKRKEILDAFQNNFLKTELSKVARTGNITKNDKLTFPGYFISRKDLIKIVALLSENIKLSNTPGDTLQSFLVNVINKFENDPNNTLNSSNDVHFGIGVKFGYGKSKQIKKPDGTTIPISNELQLVINAIKNVNDPNNREVEIASFTTAKISDVGVPINPPHGGTPYPNS